MLDLTKKFYELLDEGIIYDTDENGLGMSYGEYAEIVNYGWELIMNELNGIYNKLEWLNTLQDILNTADDDACMFFGISEDDLGLYIDEDDLSNCWMSDRIREMFNKVEFDDYDYEVA